LKTTGLETMLALALVAALPCVAGSRKTEALLYYENADGAVVFTNTPSREDVRPVPGFDGWEALGLERGASLPATIYDGFIERVARENGLSPDLIKAVAMVESGFDPHALSPKGAQGLMQLMPATAAQYGVDDPFDPLQNLRAGATHLRRLLDEFSGDLVLALAAYNAGSGAVRRHGGVPDYRETRDYVRKVGDNLDRDDTIVSRRAPSAEPVRIIRNADGSVKLVN
jgi:hypothetical protein